MTVKRNKKELFEADIAVIAQAVRKVLSEDTKYRNTKEEIPNTCFKTNIKPAWWLLGTDMKIVLESSDSKTSAMVATQSQVYITGDVFHGYDRLIKDFLNALKLELKQ